ncbi:MAG: metallophosphoesterase [Syntrophobacterales bacterium]|nr:metallophosphoesterase [Syntrophobacterales bacterium]
MGGGAGAIIVLLLAAGFSAPFIIRLGERRGYDFFARFISIIGYYWMAFLLLFCVVSLVVELYNFICLAVQSRFNRDIGNFIPTAGMRFVIPAVLSVILVIYGSFEARSLRTEFLLIHSGKVPKEIGRIRILQISDVHIVGAVGNKYVPGIIRAVREAAPDVIISTGDLVDGRGAYINEAARKFNEIVPKWGKFAITGNHEFYLGIDKALEFMNEAGFIPLRSRVATIAGAADLVGIDDHGGVMKGRGGISDRDILAQANQNHFRVFLKHRPEVEKNAVGFFDLQLSGHTHGGQLFLFNLLTKLAFPYHVGNYDLSGGSLLHVSRGAGVWGPPVRLLAPPEITVIDLVSQ